MIYFIAFTLGISGFFHPCFIGTITTFYAALVLVRDKQKFILGSILGIGFIKHRHSHLLLSTERIKNANPVLVGVFIVFSWIQSFAHIFIPMVPLISKTNSYLKIFIILPYIMGLIMPVTLFNFLPQRFKEKHKHKYTKIIGILLITLGIFISFNLFEKIEHLI
ncbi:MAG: hypothetical protein B6227_05555 [Fusobacteriia bacterium 4572_74]|nr:MAG: hypothetical protein B6227_05555 [Fusobacteriia bacterium 4572_74]